MNRICSHLHANHPVKGRILWQRGLSLLAHLLKVLPLWFLTFIGIEKLWKELCFVSLQLRHVSNTVGDTSSCIYLLLYLICLPCISPKLFFTVVNTCNQIILLQLSFLLLSLEELVLFHFIGIDAILFITLTARVSSIPIVDDNDSLLDIYSRRYPIIFTILLMAIIMFFPLVEIRKTICSIYSDITALAKDQAYTQICLDEMSIHQVNNLPLFFVFNKTFHTELLLLLMINDYKLIFHLRQFVDACRLSTHRLRMLCV